MSSTHIRHYDPDVHSMMHVTDTTELNAFLMTPGATFNDTCLGVIGWTQQQHNMEIIAIKVMSNHCHWILKPRDQNVRMGARRKASRARRRAFIPRPRLC